MDLPRWIHFLLVILNTFRFDLIKYSEINLFFLIKFNFSIKIPKNFQKIQIFFQQINSGFQIQMSIY